MQWTDNIKGLQHIGIPAKDLEKSIAFYEALSFQTVLKTSDGETKVAFLKQKGLILELYENGMAAMRDGAIDHIALDVADLEEAYDFVKGLGLKLLAEITFLPFWENGIRYFIVEGPNKERLEFAQYL